VSKAGLINIHGCVLEVASQHILRRSVSLETVMVAAGRASSLKIRWVAWLSLLLLSSVCLLLQREA